MSIPVATTTISVERLPDQSDVDPWDDPDENAPDKQWAVIARGVRAVIAEGSGNSGGPGDTELVQFRLQCDQVDLNFADRVRDESTGLHFDVIWSYDSPGIAGLSSTIAGLSRHQGLVNT